MRKAVFVGVVFGVSLAATMMAIGEVGWLQLGIVKGIPNNADGVPSNYTPVVLLANQQIRAWTNSQGKKEGDWFQATGTWAALGSWSTAIPARNVKDVKNAFIRTSAVARASDGSCTAILHVGPNAEPYKPALATSPDCQTWTYQGLVTIKGLSAIDGNSEDLILNESAPATIDPTNPLNNRFLMYEDTICFDGQTNYSNVPGCPEIAILVSADGRTWSAYRDPATGVVADFCPDRTVCGHAWWGAASRTFSGVHVLAVPNWPNTYMFHLYSCDGIHSRVLEASSSVYNVTGEKGTNLVYDQSTLLLHALTAGVHWQSLEQAYACP